MFSHCLEIVLLVFRSSHATTFLIQVIHFVRILERSYSGLRRSIPVSHAKTFRNRGRYLNILGYSVLWWNIVKHSCDFVPLSIFNFPFFVRTFSKTLIVDYDVISSYGTPCLASCAYWVCTFHASRNCLMKTFLQLHPCVYKTFTLKTNSWLLQFHTTMMHLILYKNNRLCFKLILHWVNNCTKS